MQQTAEYYAYLLIISTMKNWEDRRCIWGKQVQHESSTTENKQQP